ncbi:hypothetical protein [Pseudomonas cedrina]|uniref:hypothetical protein n=1 Tax=Pseudomonas cedrina TaxID=651740 RepID=UPI0027878ED7|nr:hypothetical protein [Pseudomonas cedrina]MDQ0652383.1 hypothetical protein [Pseudomonas cedrina]
MKILIPTDINHITDHINQFIALAGHKLWYKRVDLLNKELDSPFLAKIVSDYHWLEMAISFQAEVLAKENRLIPELIDASILTALNFAAFTVEVHAKLSDTGKKVLEGRLRDCLKSETGFAPLYLELDLAQRLMNSGYDVQFTDLEGLSQFDLFFSREDSSGEMECKSLSADAGRQIHRKDFYRFMESISPALALHRQQDRQEALLITLKARLSPNVQQQLELLRNTISALKNETHLLIEHPEFKIDRISYSELFLSGRASPDESDLYAACQKAYGPNIHVAGALTEKGGCLIVMRSQKDDDPSKPMLDAMRKAGTQFSGQRPAYIAIQQHGIEHSKLMSAPVLRQAVALSSALYIHYAASHVNGTYVTGFGAVALQDGRVATPGFVVLNPTPTFPFGIENEELFFNFS